MPLVAAVLNDLDGLLVNSEQLYLEANQRYFKQFNLEFTADMHRQGTGRKFDQWIKTVFPAIPLSGSEILARRNEIFFQLAEQKLALLPGAQEYLDMVSHHFVNALVTSSQQDYLDVVFRKTGIHTCFDLVIDGAMVQTGKPDPECYLLAARTLAVDPQQCLVFEDAPSGVQAGKAAGMRVVTIPSPFVTKDPALAQADFRLSSLTEVTVDWIKAL
jgi:mannitol-1-/sugar-/sorbitol-6-/2-deoxyglucose-6-phosphatase